VGTAALLAVAAVLALAVGAIVRHAVGAIVAVLAGLVLPYLLAAVLPVLPAPAAEWLLRVSPAAGFAVQQTMLAYPQVDAAYTPFDGYYPLAPWQGFAVLCGWALLALAVATLLLRRRDA
jgi:ABC-type transport system involved in multi-copper enzyme maturation permease subunit